jgi:hypothetical protein
MSENIITVDHASFNLRKSGYNYNIDNPFVPDRGLGKVHYCAKILKFNHPVRIDEEFPWNDADRSVFELANPIHLIAYRDTDLVERNVRVFAIGSPRQHSQGLLVGCLGGSQFGPQGGDTYLPSWVARPDELRPQLDPKLAILLRSEGFPAGTGFLVVKACS